MTDTSTRFGESMPKADKTDPFALVTMLRQRTAQREAKVAGWIKGTKAARLALTINSAIDGFVFDETDTPHIYYCDGAAWTRMDALEEGGTAFPGSPVDGQRVTLALAIGSQYAGNIAWQHVYDSALSGSRKWKFAGGAPIIVETRADYSLSADAAFHYGGAVPAVNSPFDGYYEVDWGAEIFQSSSGAWVSAALQVSGSEYDVSVVQHGAGEYRQIIGKSFVSVAAAVALQVGVAGSGGGTTNVRRRWISVRPIRVSP